MECKEILDKISIQYSSILNQKLVGIYVHGSLAFGCFNFDKSDIDFIVVVNNLLTIDEKESLIKTLLDLSHEAPKKGFEMSIVLEKDCKNFKYPTYFDLHYSIAHLERCKNNLKEYCETMNGEDKDLAAHFTIIKAVGYKLVGKEINEVFEDVPKEYYFDSLKYDVEDAKENVKEDPVYTILNLCRVLAYKKDELILSKEQGGNWGIKNLPKEYNEIIFKALEDYKTEKNDIYDYKKCLKFCEYCIKNIF